MEVLMALTYKNPVWSGYFADPFVLKWQGAYYAYGTGPVPDSQERAFPMLYSQDFAHWEYRGGALEALPGQSEVEYWAPEVAERNGLFYMYYAAQCRLRVAIANHPSGPFRDTGCLIFPDLEFSIDAHPFKDPKD